MKPFKIAIHYSHLKKKNNAHAYYIRGCSNEKLVNINFFSFSIRETMMSPLKILLNA